MGIIFGKCLKLDEIFFFCRSTRLSTMIIVNAMQFLEIMPPEEMLFLIVN